MWYRQKNIRVKLEDVTWALSYYIPDGSDPLGASVGSGVRIREFRIAVE